MTYLGMPLGASFKAKSVCNSILEKLESIVDYQVGRNFICQKGGH